MPGGASFGLPFGQTGRRLVGVEAIDDFKVILFQRILEHFGAAFHFDGINRLQVLVIEGAPLLRALE
ncbi:hypothetical protein D3C86_1696610 [compost metagenome]